MISERKKALFLKDAVLTLEKDEQEKLIRMASEMGFNTIVVESLRDVTEFLARCSERGIDLVSSIPCFSDHLDLTEFPWDRPRTRDGAVVEKMEWYEGISPLDERRVEFVKNRITNLLSSGAQAIAFDFIRWPVHWELEFRDPNSPPPSAHYGLEEVGPSALWEAMSNRVNELVAAFVNHAREINPDVWIGLFLVPAETDEQRLVTGQDPVALARLVDALVIMSYHAILGRDPSWVAHIAKSLRAVVATPVIPMVQLTSDATYAEGWDWGLPVPDAEGMRIAGELALDGFSDLIVFPGEAVLERAVTWPVEGQDTLA